MVHLSYLRRTAPRGSTELDTWRQLTFGSEPNELGQIAFDINDVLTGTDGFGLCLPCLMYHDDLSSSKNAPVCLQY
jgi:hypothetical protein